jgi:hypothetical protein
MVMGTEHVITRKAADGTLTIPELREFLAEFDKAADPGAPGVTVNADGMRVKARVGFSGGIKSISVTIPGKAEQ